MTTISRVFSVSVACLALVGVAGCGDDDGNDADRVGIAATCTATADCASIGLDDGGVLQLECLTNFGGGYCGLPDCAVSADCPVGSICVLHTDARTYCFRQCVDKPECNVNRPASLEANCSSSFNFNDPADDHGEKACIPPSSGI